MRLVLALFSLILLDCGPTPPDDAGTDPVDANIEATLEIGQGFEVFESVPEGGTVFLVSGCQGSQHIWTAVRAWGLDRRGTVIDLELVRDRDEMVVSQAFRVRISLMDVGEAYNELNGLTLQVPDPDMALDEDMTIRAVVTDMNGVEVTDERSVRVEWDREGGCG